MFKIAMLSRWHVHAKGYAKRVKESGKAEIIAVWNEDKKEGKEWAEELGCKFYSDLDKVLALKDLDAVICDAPTTHHKDILIKAAKAGKHIFTEKALAPTVEECYEIKKAIEEAGVTFCISYPYKIAPFYVFAKKQAEKGTFGKITLVRVRNAHEGVSGGWLPDRWFDKSTAGGGAMMDLGCHPVYLLADMLGKPKRVTGMFTAPLGKPVDENAVALCEFEGGALGVAETGFDSFASPFMFEVYGTEASMVCRGGSDILFKSKEMKDFTTVPVLPKQEQSQLLTWIDNCIEGKGSPAGMGIDDAIDLTRILEYAYKGDENNKIYTKLK